MEMNHQGYWRATVPLEDGTYDYQFEVISKSWFAEGKPSASLTPPPSK